MKKMKITYLFDFDSPQKRKFEMVFDCKTMDLIDYTRDEKNSPDSSWARLENKKCQHCPLNAASSPYCPIALNLSHVATSFKGEKSYRETTVGVLTEDRSYFKKVPLQDGLFGIFGLIMATSGCPHMYWFKPMARHHLPFSTSDETIIRSLSMYLINQYFLFQKGGSPDWKLDTLKKFYDQVQRVNSGIIERIRTITTGDADENAIIILDSFGQLLSIEMSNNFSEIEELVSYEHYKLEPIK